MESAVCAQHAAQIDEGAAWFCRNEDGLLLMGDDLPGQLLTWSVSEGFTSNTGAELELRILYRKGGTERDADFFMTREQARRMAQFWRGPW